MRLVLASVLLLASTGCTWGSDGDQQQTASSWTARTATTIDHSLFVEQDHAVLLVSPDDGSDIYASALAVDALAQAGELTDQEWSSFARRVRREVDDDDGLTASVAGPSSTALELMTAATLAHRTLVSHRFESALRGAAPPMPGDGFDLYDGIAALALAGAEPARGMEEIRTSVRESLDALVTENGCAATETLYALGAAATVDETSDACSRRQVHDLVGDQLDRAVADVAQHPDRAGLPHAEVLLAAARLARAAEITDLQPLVALERSLVSALEENRRLGASASAGVIAQAVSVVDQPLELGDALVALLRRTVLDGGEPQVVEMGPTTRALLVRTLRLVGDEPPADLLAPAARADVTSRLNNQLALDTGPDLALVTALGHELNKRSPALSSRDRQARVAVLLRAVNRLGSSTCAIPDVTSVIDAAETLRAERPSDTALRLRWQRLCGHPEPTAERQLVNKINSGGNRARSRTPGVDELLSAWQSAVVNCALAPRRLDPEQEWRTFHALASPGGGVSGANGLSLDVTNTFALVSLTSDPSRACHAGTFG